MSFRPRIYKAQDAYYSVLTLDRHGHSIFARSYMDRWCHVRRASLDRSKYDPKRDEGQPGWRRRMAKQEYLT